MLLTRRAATIIALVMLLAAFQLGPSTPAIDGSRSRESEKSEDEERIQRTGRAPLTTPMVRAPAPGWAGEKPFGGGNDWEPSVAADPSSLYVHMATTRYSGAGACGNCPLPYIVLRTSSNGGQAFGPVGFICACPGTNGQYDPVIRSDADGDLYATWLNNNPVVFSRSTDNGQTWTPPVNVSGPLNWGDKPWIAVGPSGQDVYILFNHSDSYVVSSHDFGQTWSDPEQTNTNNRFHYVNGGFVASDGDVTFTQQNYAQSFTGPISVVATRSGDGGSSWQTTFLDTVQEQPSCNTRGCPFDHYGGQASLAGDADGDLLVAYTGANKPRGRQFIFTRRSSDGGATWSGRIAVSPNRRGIVASFPAVVSPADGEFRLTFQDDRKGNKNWNTWYKRSTDGGVTWSGPLRISDARGGAGYKDAGGFDADYGDYQDLAITSSGETFVVWGEGFNYYGPGGTWYNREV
ncbi:MAG: sialidase family protein [Actinomycetota bacterium]